MSNCSLNISLSQGQIDKIVERLLSHVQMAFSQQPFDARLCKYIIFTLMTVVEGPLAKRLTIDVVTVVMHELIMLTLLYGQDKNEQTQLLVRAINATVVSFTDNADPTVTLCFMVCAYPLSDLELKGFGWLTDWAIGCFVYIL